MKLSKYIARNIVFPSIVNIGIERLMSKNSSNKLLNLYYHGVVQKDSNFFSPRHLEANQFERQIRYLKKHFDIISIDDAFEVKKGNIKLERPTVTISFDDGYQNNITNALPILEKYNVKTTFFISGFCTENNSESLLWTDIIAFAKYFCKGKHLKLQDVAFDNFIESETGLSIKDFLKNKSRTYRDTSMTELIEKCDIMSKLEKIPGEIWKLLNSSEIRSLSDSNNVDIASHGFRHYNLGGIALNEAMDDMIMSKRAIEKVISKPIDMICYPDGSYSPSVIREAINMGFKKNVCCDYLYDGDNESFNIINRYGISNTTTFESNIFFINRNFKLKGV